MIRIASAAVAAVLAAGISLVGTIPASAAAAVPQTAVCKWVVTASELYIHSAPNDKASSRIGQTYDGDSVSASLPLTETNGYLLANSNGYHGYMDASYLKSKGCN